MVWWAVFLGFLVLTLVLAGYVLQRRRRAHRSSDAAWTRPEKLSLATLICSTVASAVTVIVGVLDGSAPNPSQATNSSSASSASVDNRVASVSVVEASEQVPAPTLNIKIRNVGAQVSVVTSVTMTVQSYGVLTICEAGGALQTSATYPVTLPVPAAPGDVITVPVSHELGPNAADSFDITAGVGNQIDSSSAAPGFYVYVLTLAILHDGSTTPVPAGEAVLVVPAYTETAGIPDYSNFLVDEEGAGFDEEDYGRVLPCYRANRDLLQQARSVDGALPPSLVATPGLD